jgi:hypothetical protein
MTSAAADASRKFWVLLRETRVSSLFVFGSNTIAVSLPWIGRSLEASFAVVGDQLLRSHPISVRETAPTHAEGPKMTCQLIDCCDLHGRAAKSPVKL